MLNYKAQLDNAAFALRDKVGKVLSSGSEIISLRERADNYRAIGNVEVQKIAEAVYAKAAGLLDNYRAIESDAASLTVQAASLRSEMDKDILWKNIISNPGLTLSLGWQAISQINAYIGKAVSLIQNINSLTTRANRHLAAVDDLRGDVNDLENFAQGKGLSAKLAKVGTFAGTFAGDYVSMLKYAAMAVGAFFVWDIAKPFVMAKKRL